MGIQKDIYEFGPSQIKLAGLLITWLQDDNIIDNVISYSIESDFVGIFVSYLVDHSNINDFGLA